MSVPRTPPENSAGPSTTTFMIGSSSRGFARSKPSRHAPRAASWKAMSDESTAWLAPSLMTTRTFTTGNPSSRPLPSIERKPFSTAEMNSRGIAPPTTSSTNSGSSRGSMYPHTWPNWPDPPVCFLCV